MSDELLSQYLDRAAVTSDTDFLIKELKRAQEAFDLLNKAKITITPGSALTDISAGTEKAKKATTDLTAAQIELTKATKEKIIVDSKGYQALIAEIDAKNKAAESTKDLTESEKESTKTGKEKAETDKKGTDTSKEKAAADREAAKNSKAKAAQDKADAKAAADASNDYKQLSLAFNDAALKAKNYQIQLGANHPIAVQAVKDANVLDTQLKALDKSVGQSQRNVGNYADAFGGKFAAAFAVLTKELEGIRKKIATVGTDTSGLKKLEQEEKLLTQLTENLGKAFNSPTQELRAFTNAAKDIGQQFGVASNTFNEFVEKVGAKKNELQDIQATINFQASDTKYLDGIVSAVTGLAGAYGVAQSAQALWGEEDKDMQKQMIKLQAVLTLVTSLQAVLNAVQTESGAVQVALAAKTGLLNAARAIQAALIGEAGAAGIATTATTTFATALIATGIGAIVVAIAAGVVYLVSKIQDWSAASASLVKSNEALTTSLSDLVSATKEYESIRSLSAQKELKDLENLVEQRKASGITAGQSLALDKKIAEQKLKTANQDAQLYNITAETLKKSQALAKQDAAVVILAEKDKRKFIEETTKAGNKDYEDRLEQLDKSLALRKQEAAASKAVFDFANENAQKQAEATAQIDLIATQEAKLNSDERRKLILESARIESDIIQTKNSFILSNETSTLDQRLAAIKSNAVEQKKIIQAELTATLNDPSVSGVDKNIAQKKAAADKAKITKETNRLIFDQEEADRKRSAKAQLDFDKATLDADKAVQEQIISNAFSSSDEKINAIIESNRDQKAAIDEEYQYTKSASILSKEELLVVDQDYQNKQIALARSTAAQLKAVQEKAKMDHIEILKLEQKEALDTEHTIDINALQKGFDLGLISQREYNKQRIDLEYKYAKDSLAIEIDALKEQLATVKLTNLQRAQLNSQLAALENKLADDGLKHFEDVQKEKLRVIKDTFDQIGEIGNSVFGIIDGILNANAVKQKNELDAQAEANEKKAARDIELVNASTLSEQDKAAKITVINARLAAQKDQIARKEKQADLDRAKFQKAAAVFNIILSTAQAVIKAAPVIPLMIFAAVVGAAQLAIALATPVPKYRHGKNLDNYEGPVIVNDGPKDEVIQREDGSIEFPQGRNVLSYAGKRDIIHPDKDAWLNAILNAAHRDANAGMKFTPAKNSGDNLTLALEKQTKSIVSAIRNKREIIIKGVSGKDIMFRDGNNSIIYLNNNLQ